MKITRKVDRDGIRSLLFEGPVWLVRRTKAAKRLRRLQLQTRYETVSDTNNTFHVDPQTVRFHILNSKYTRHDCGQKGRFHKKYHSGLVLPGSWDVYKNPIETEPIYRAYRRRYEDGVSWERTEYGAQVQRVYEQGGKRKGYPTIEQYFKSRDELYEKITSEGYDPEHGSVRINIGRSGELISNNDVRHRLAICRISGMDQIPVEVVVRHKKWQSIRKKAEEENSIKNWQ